MKDPNDPYTPDLFDAAQRHPGKSPEKSPRQKYYNPCNKRLDMWVSPRCSVQLDDFGTVAWLHQATAGGNLLSGMAGGKTGDDAGRAAGDIANSFHP